MGDRLKTNTPRTNVTDAYKIHNDRGLIYNPLSRDAIRDNKINFSCESVHSGKLTTNDGYEIEYSVPTTATAYDIIPIKYKITKSNYTESIHVLATCLEDSNRKNEEYYSNILPGNIKVDFTYLGYVVAENHPERRARHHGDFVSDKQADKYPMYDASELVLSNELPHADYFWLKFKYKNTGNTILSVNGNGTFCFEPILQKKDENDLWQIVSKNNNLFIRLLDDLYPGEEGEFYASFENTLSLQPGEYRILINCLVRNETSNPENFLTNIWGGAVYETAYMDFSIKDSDYKLSLSPITYTYKPSVQRNSWLHTYEEFLTSFDSWHNTFDLDLSKPEENIMYLQCAPWSNCVTLKLLTGNSMNQNAITIPLNVESDSIKVKLDTEHLNYIIDNNGKRLPAVIAQSMCDMRVHVALGPEADQTLINELLDMNEAGVNLISTTAAFETLINDDPKSFNHNTDAHWFMCDVIKQLGMKLEGWITYPYDSPYNVAKARWITGDKKFDPSKVSCVDSPLLSEACGIKSLYQFRRWGDNYFVDGKGRVPIVTEDTRGWHRVDIQNRWKLDEPTKDKFRNWLINKYHTIENLNEYWGSSYVDFNSIDPEEGTTIDHGNPSYMTPNAAFTEWTRPLEDLDIFRTESRLGNYRTILDKTDEYFNGIIGFRTEGGNWTSVVPYDSGNQNYRHVYYSQRRVAAMPEQLANSGLITIHSDYCTLPYTPTEVAELTKLSIEQGITPMHMIQADRMRDIAINEHYGQDYSVRYNIGDGPHRGAYISTVISLFGWFKATYENGGIPGVLWEDYLCDGYVTSMQKKEMQFFKQKLEEALNTPEGKQWQNSSNIDTKLAVSKSEAYNSYKPEYISELIEKCRKNRK